MPYNNSRSLPNSSSGCKPPNNPRIENMNSIHLQKTLPAIFAHRNTVTSDIWHQDITFHKGKNYLIEAGSGTGKSSLFSYMYGYRHDYQGIINFNERNIRSLSVDEWVAVRRQSLSILFQELRLFPELTALENVQLKNRLTNHKRKKEILSLFEALDIADKMNEKVGKLSFGQQQRVAFIRCLCQPYDFMFLDEPISHLDDENGGIMGRLLQEEAAKQGAGVLISSIGKHLPLDYDFRYSL